MKSPLRLNKIHKKILADYDNYCLIKYIKKLQPTWTKVFIYKQIRTKNILINGKKTTINYKIKEGDILELYGYTEKSKVQNLKSLKKLEVIYEDENLIIVNKESKISVQEDKKNLINTMNNRLLKHLNWDPNGEEWKPIFIHRLDHNTTGLLIGAKNYQTYSQLIKAQKNQQIEKYYKALVHRAVKFKNTTVKCYLIKEKNKMKISHNPIPKAKFSETRISLVKHIFPLNSSLLELKLITGRTHQIRAHLSHLNHSIRGDQKYGIEKNIKQYPYPALTAYKISFSKDIKGDKLSNIVGKSFEIKDIWFEKNLG